MSSTSSALAAQNTQVRVGAGGAVYLTGYLTSGTGATSYNLSDGLQAASGVSQLTAAGPGSKDLFMMTFDPAGACTQAADVLPSTTGFTAPATTPVIELDRHEGFLLGGTVGAPGTGKDNAGNVLGAASAGQAVTRVQGSRNASSLQIIPFQSNGNGQVTFCDIRYDGPSSSAYALLYISCATSTFIPNLDGSMSTKAFTRVVNSDYGGGLYLVKYNATTNAVVYGDLVTSSPVFMTAPYLQYHSRPRLRIAPSGDVYVLACSVNADYNSSTATFRHAVYNVDGTGTTGVNLPYETYSALTRVLLVRYSSAGAVLMANYVVSNNGGYTGVTMYPTALEIDASNNVYVAFVASVPNTNSCAVLNHLDQTQTTVKFGTTYNHYAGWSNSSPFLMKFSSAGIIQWGRQVLTDRSGNSAGYYSSIQGLNVVNDKIYLTGCGSLSCNYVVFNPDYSTYATWAAYNGNNRHYTWMMQLNTATSAVLLAQVVLVGQYIYGPSWCGIGCTFTDASNNIWVGLTYDPYDWNTTYTPLMIDLVQNGDADKTPNYTYRYVPNNPSINGDVVDTWGSQQISCYAMRLNTTTNQFDMASRRPMITTSNGDATTYRILSGGVDPSGNLFFLMSTTGGRDNYVYNFDGTVGCKSAFVASDGGPYQVACVKYSPSGVFSNCVYLTSASPISGALATVGANSVLFGTNVAYYGTNTPYNGAMTRIVDENENMIAAMMQQSFSPMLSWNHNYAALSAANSPVGSLASYTTWVADTLPSAPTASVGVGSSRYAFGYYSATTTVPIKNMTGSLSEHALPSTAGALAAYAVGFDANMTCFQSTMILSGVSSTSPTISAVARATEIAVAFVAGGVAVTVYNLDGTMSGTLTTAAGSVVVAHYSVASGACTSAYVLVSGGDATNAVTAFHHDAYGGGYVLCGTLSSAAGAAIAPSGNNNISLSAAGGFVIKVGPAKTIVYAGTILPGGAVIGASVGTMGLVAIVGTSGVGAGVVSPLTGAKTVLPSSSSSVAILAQLTAAGDYNAALVLGSATPVGVRYTGEDEVVVVAALGVVSQAITDAITGSGVSAWVSTTTAPSTGILWTTRSLLVSKYCSVVSQFSRPTHMAVGTTGEILVFGTTSTTYGSPMTATGLLAGSSSTQQTLAPVTTSDAFLMSFQRTGQLSKLSRVSSMSTTPVGMSMSVPTNTVFLSLSTTGNGTLYDPAASGTGSALYPVTNGVARKLWVLSPLNMDTTALTPTITINLPVVGDGTVVNNKLVVVPSGAPFNVNASGSVLKSIASVTTPSAGYAFTSSVGAWSSKS